MDVNWSYEQFAKFFQQNYQTGPGHRTCFACRLAIPKGVYHMRFSPSGYSRDGYVNVCTKCLVLMGKIFSGPVSTHAPGTLDFKISVIEHLQGLQKEGQHVAAPTI